MINNPMIVKRGGGQDSLYLDLENLGHVGENNDGVIPVILSGLKPNAVAVIATSDTDSRSLVAWKYNANSWSYQYYSSGGLRHTSKVLSSSDDVFPWPINPEGVYGHTSWYLYQLVSE